MPPKLIEVRYVRSGKLVVDAGDARSASTANFGFARSVEEKATKAITVGSSGGINIRRLNEAVRAPRSPAPELTGAAKREVTG